MPFFRVHVGAWMEVVTEADTALEAVHDGIEFAKSFPLAAWTVADAAPVFEIEEEPADG